MKTIYIIHGWTYTLDAWQACVQELQKRGYEVQLLQVPGLTTQSRKVWTLEEYVEWLHGELTKASPTQPVTLVGHSNGGRIAIAYAARYPERLKHLILIDAAGVVHTEWYLRLKRSLGKIVASIGKAITPELLQKSGRKLLYKLLGVKDYDRASEEMRQTMRALIARSLEPELAKITIPTLLLWGAKDTATPVSDSTKMQALIKNAQRVIITNAGHSPHKTDPTRVAREITTWLEMN